MRDFGIHGGFRVVDLPSANVQPVQPLLTDFVLTGGTELPEFDIQGALFPRRTAPNILFLLGQTDGSEMVRHDTRRSDRAEIRYSSFGWTKVAHKTQRRTFASLFDVREAANADPWDVAGRAAMQAREIVERDTLAGVADIVADDANYGDVLTVVAGDGWNQVGGSKADILRAVKIIETKTGVPRTRLKVALFGTARDAALEDPEFLAARTYQQRGAVYPTYSEVAAYWGVGDVSAYYALEKASLTADATEMFPNAAVVYYPGDPRKLNSLEGGMAWGGTFEFVRGQALTPYYKPDFTSWCYPWENDQVVLISKVDAAAIIKTPYHA